MTKIIIIPMISLDINLRMNSLVKHIATNKYWKKRVKFKMPNKILFYSAHDKNLTSFIISALLTNGQVENYCSWQSLKH